MLYDLPELLRRVEKKLADPTVFYMLAAHYYDRDNHPRRRHYPAVFTLHQGEVANLTVGSTDLAFDTALVRFPEDGEEHAPGPWADRFRATIPFEQLYHVMRKVVPAGQPTGKQLHFSSDDSVYYNERVYRDNYPSPWTIMSPEA
ncbi:hypothetical protein [Hymenobacter weizhouensis]|uniref:hypothetical protein n=1 Tax=Hymenobacter sp. YIM 151500-1 TaxID=2987689 RepID=UPI002226F7CB|nr:hypothetical protein [Hymenobacter sp. YIM 151500-1]UYZ65280.1 hypothetical protein OIS53_20030 [Hymenobacter sp. YIM 151500-1]